MPYDANGVFSLAPGYLAVAGQTIQPSQHNPPLEDIITNGLSAVLVRDGRAPMTGNLNMGGFKLTNVLAGTNSLDGVNKTQLDLQSVKFATKSTNYTALAADNSTATRFTANATLALTAAATLGASWNYTIIADGGDVTIDPNGAETIDGATTLVVPNGVTTTIYCDGSAFRTNLGQNRPLLDIVQGVELSNNSGNPTTHVDFAAGTVVKGPLIVRNLAAFTKRINATFSAGSGNGGLDTGAVGASGTYFAYALRKDSDRTFDVVFSASATSAGVTTTLLTGYTIIKQIGVVLTDASSLIRQFIMYARDEYTFVTPIKDAVSAAISSTSALLSLTVPNGVKSKAKLRFQYQSTATTASALISDPAQGVLAAGIGNDGGNIGTVQVASGFSVGTGDIWTNTSKQVRYVAGASGNLWVWTDGFHFPCGRVS
ncbi:hypothetical protein EVC14_018 [Rhizobium phage RHph_I3_18]|nr:hypothetical protein EVC14_018 [Rhizobium phage RHph_I3_18]